MLKRMSTRDWVEKYKLAVQNEELVKILKSETMQKTGSWSFLKLAFLWSFAYTYTNIIGSRFQSMCYVDLFSGCGLNLFRDYSKKSQFLLGSPVIMATIPFKHNFKKCFFFEENPENLTALQKRLEIIKEENKLTCDDYEIFKGDSNKNIDELIKNLEKLSGVHFLLFVDPYSTEIKWETMEKLLSLEHLPFDMIFNFQPFGVNRKSYQPETLDDYFGDNDYKKYLGRENVLGLLESYYIQKLKNFKMAKTTRVIKIESGGKGGFYYSLIYTTRKPQPPWLPAVDHIKRMVEKLSGREIKIITDPSMRTIDLSKIS